MRTISQVRQLVTKAIYPLSVWLGTVALLAAPPITRHRRRIISGAFSSVRRKLPVISIDEIVGSVPDSEEIRLAVLETRPHNMSLFEVFCLAAITRKLDPSIVLEIGTYDGRSAMAIARNMTGTIYTVNLGPDYIDLHPNQAYRVDIQLSRKVPSGGRMLAPETERIVQLYSDSTKLEFSRFGLVDLVVIDGGHDYDVVKSDTENALRVINRQRGAIIWHDAVDYGVGRLLPTLGLPLSIIDGTVLAILVFDNGRPIDLAHEHIGGRMRR